MNSKIELFKLFNNLYEFNNGTKNGELLKTLDIMYKNNFNALQEITKEKIIETNISYIQLLEILQQITNQDYLLYYLLIHFNVRNMDLIIKFTNDSVLINDVMNNKINQNILFYNNEKKLVYVRNDYKTQKKYGFKLHYITDEMFLKYCEDLTHEKLIFTNRSGKSKSSDEITRFIKITGNKIFKNSNLNQQLIYKIIVKHFEDLNDNSNLKRISHNRGHTRETQEYYYSGQKI